MQHPNPETIHHESHDSTLIAGHAAGDLTDSERQRAQALMTSCAPCSDLHRDLLAIAAATQALPNLASSPRDFRLDAEQAARLRRGSWLRAALRPFASPRSATRPVAAAFTSLGVAGLFVVTVLPGMVGLAGSPAARQGEAAGAPSSSAAPAAAPGGPVSGLGNDATLVPVFAVDSARPDAPDDMTPEDTSVKVLATEESEGAVAAGNGSPDVDREATDGGRLATTSPPNPVLIGSAALLAVGIMLFGLRFAARRIR